MAKGKAKQRQAGAAAAPTVRAPTGQVFTPPDPDASTKYQQLVEVFSRAFEKAGITPSKELWRVWGERHNGSSKALHNLGCLLDSLYEHYNHPSLAASLVSLFLHRTLLLSGISRFEGLFHPMTSQHAPGARLTVLFTILGVFTAADDTKGVPDECLPDPATQAALAPLQWHPRSIELVCLKMMALDGSRAGHSVIGYIQLLGDQAQDPPIYSQAADAPHVDFNAVLEDRASMHAILRVLQNLAFEPLALHLLVPLSLRSKPRSPGARHPCSLSHLLSIGAAEPLTTALNNLSSTAATQQHMPRENAVRCLSQLVRFVSQAAQHDHDVRLRIEECSGTASVKAAAAWPSTLLEAHLQALIMVVSASVVGTVTDREGSHQSCVHGLRLYPSASMPTAARLLSLHPTALSVLLRFIEQSVDPAPSARAQSIDACRAGMEFFLRLLKLECSTDFLQRLPSRLGAAAVKSILLAASVEEHMQGPAIPGLCDTEPSGATSTAPSRSSCADLLEVAANVLVIMSQLPGYKDAVRGFESMLVECPKWAIFWKVLAFSGAQPSDISKMGALSGMVDERGHWSGAMKSGALADLVAIALVFAAGFRHGGPGSAFAGSDGGGAAGGGDCAVESSVCGAGPSHKHAGTPERATPGNDSSSKGVGMTKSTDNSAPSSAGASGSAKAEGGSSARHADAGKPDRVCASCGRVGKLKACGRCGVVWFCGVSCQKIAWPSHRQVCVPKGAAPP